MSGANSPYADQGATARARRQRFGLLLAAGVSAVVAWLIVLPALRAPNFGISVYPEGRIEIRDFPSILTFARAFWKGNANYDVDSYIRVTSEWAGQSLDIALPFPYSPTMLWLLAPFSVLPTAWAFTLWTLLGLCVVWWLTGPRWPIWVGLAFFSPIAMVCFSLGQTAVLSTAAMLSLRSAAAASDSKGTGRQRHHLFGGALLWALGAKPPVAVTAAVALLGGRQWPVLLVGFAMTLVSTLLLMPRLGAAGLLDYMGMLAHYDTETPGFFAWSLVPERMGNLRALLHVTLGFGDTVAFRFSAAVWVCALAAFLWAAHHGKLDLMQRWGLAVLAYLLFCPHVIATEELHLVLILALCGDWRAQANPTAAGAVIGLTLLVLYSAPGLVGASAVRVAVVFTAKLGLALLLIARFGVSSPRCVGTSHSAASGDSR